MVGLTRERIFRTAMSMADRDGFEAVTLRRIASELGVHVTSLYNHVPTREAVTDGIVELLIDEAKLPTEPLRWDEWVRRFAAALKDVAATHPGAFAAFQYRPVQGPRAALVFELALAAFEKAGFGPEDAYAAFKACSYTALSIGLERAAVSRGPLPETALDQLPPESFPQLRSVRESDPEASWAFAVETLVSGLRSQLRRRRSN